MTGKYVFRLFLFLFVISCSVREEKPDEYGGDITGQNEKLEELVQSLAFERVDSLAYQIIKTAERNNNFDALINANTQLASSYIDRGNPEEALEFSDRALEIAEVHGTAKQRARVLIQKANGYNMMNRSVEALASIEEAKSYISYIDDSEVEAIIYATHASIISSYDPVGALKRNFEALQLFQQAENRENEAITRNNIGLIYHDQGDYEEALEEFERALQLNLEAGDEVQLAIIYNNIANTKKNMGHIDESVESLLKAISLNEKLGRITSQIRNYYNLAETYREMGEYDLAYAYYSEAYDMSHEINFAPGVMYHSSGLAKVLYSLGRYDDVMGYIEESRQLAEEMENLPMLLRGWDLQATLMAGLGAYQDALQAEQQVRVYSDSANQQRRDREFEEVRATYDFDLAMAENELLRQELEYQERLSRNQQWVLILLIAGVFTTAGFLVVFYRNQKKLHGAYFDLEQKNQQLTGKKEQLENLNQELKKLNSDKDRLIDIIVHDLRNPLFGVIGFLEVVRETVTDETELQHLEMARNSAYRLNHLINSLLEVHSLEKQAEELKMEQIRADHVVTELIYSYKEMARKKEITIVEDIGSFEVVSNTPYINRILDNLISNALKFSPQGETVYVGLKKTEADTWQLTVSDNGPGFSSEDRQKMYQMFGKLSARPTNGEDSTGLGLYAVQLLVKRLGGHIILDSERGQGSTFICEFPVRMEQSIPAQDPVLS